MPDPPVSLSCFCPSSPFLSGLFCFHLPSTPEGVIMKMKASPRNTMRLTDVCIRQCPRTTGSSIGCKRCARWTPCYHGKAPPLLRKRKDGLFLSGQNGMSLMYVLVVNQSTPRTSLHFRSRIHMDRRMSPAIASRDPSTTRWP